MARDNVAMPELIQWILQPESGFQWDPRYTMARNVSRLIYGEEDVHQQNSSTPSASQDDQECSCLICNRTLRFNHQSIIAAELKLPDLLPGASRPTGIVEVAERMSLLSIDSSLSPLKILQLQVHNIFSKGLETASDVLSRMRSAAIRNDNHIDKDLMYTKHMPLLMDWESCAPASATVLFFASPKERLFSALQFNSIYLGDFPTLDKIRRTPTSSFTSAYSKAKSVAQGPTQRTTVICVSLMDVHIFELAKIGRDRDYSTFAHCFVIGIGPEGIIIWQAWGENGYRLDEYLARGGGRTRSWSEADAFAKDFESFVGINVSVPFIR